MIKNYFFILTIVIFFSCTSQDIKITEQSEVFVKKEIGQLSVVDTVFENSVLYQQFSRWRKEGPIIPGLQQALVPQGMAYWEECSLMIISNYMSDDTAGVLTVINMADEALDKVLYLYNADKTFHKGHLGGLAVSRDYLWIASDPGIYYVSLETIRAAEVGGKIFLSELIETETKGSFATFSDNILWVGEFTREDGSYPVPKHHNRIARDGNFHRGLLAGFELNTLTDMINIENKIGGRVIPDFILSIPDEIQGAVFIHDKILLSASFGRNNSSRLLLFNNPLSEQSHQSQEVFPSRDIPLWFLDDINLIGKIIVPPMTEAVTIYKNTIAVLFESAALKYRRTASFPVDRIQFLPLNAFGLD